MKKISLSFFVVLVFLLLFLQNESVLYAQATVKGIVYHDRSVNGFFDSQDVPLEGIAVSNGREVHITDQDGIYELPLRENAAIFVIKPRNWTNPVDENQINRFYYMHSQDGISAKDYNGFPPSGPIPEWVNFPLYPVDEPDDYKVLILGDTQSRNEQEIHYLGHDVFPELLETGAAFGITLGDIVFNDLNLFDPTIEFHSVIGIPWRYVSGNHDKDHSAFNTTDANGSWFRTFGPSYYSFNYGPVHYVVLDNVRWSGREKRPFYRLGLGEDQMEFLTNDLKHLDKNQLLVIFAHIPIGSSGWENEVEQKAFYELIAGHPYSVSLVAHTHRHYHQFIDNENGFPGDNPHHMISIGTVCGSWWTGSPNEYGIPHAMMSDGTPNGYAFLHIDGKDWKLRWKTAGKQADYQMHIHAPDFIFADSNEKIKVTANIYNALPSADVKMKIGNGGDWITMKKSEERDPFLLDAEEREDQLGEVPWRKIGSMGKAGISNHIWIAEPTIRLDPGVYVIHVKAKDEWWEYEGKRLLHVKFAK